MDHIFNIFKYSRKNTSRQISHVNNLLFFKLVNTDKYLINSNKSLINKYKHYLMSSDENIINYCINNNISIEFNLRAIDNNQISNYIIKSLVHENSNFIIFVFNTVGLNQFKLIINIILDNNNHNFDMFYDLMYHFSANSINIYNIFSSHTDINFDNNIEKYILNNNVHEFTNYTLNELLIECCTVIDNFSLFKHLCKNKKIKDETIHKLSGYMCGSDRINFFKYCYKKNTINYQRCINSCLISQNITILNHLWVNGHVNLGSIDLNYLGVNLYGCIFDDENVLNTLKFLMDKNLIFPDDIRNCKWFLNFMRNNKYIKTIAYLNVNNIIDLSI